MSKRWVKFVTAACVYSAFAVYLYLPHMKQFGRWDYLLIINSVLAGLGCYVLSRRWVAGFAGSFFAGAIYGFGPFLLGLAKYHPTAGSLAAVIPWLFCPAVFGPHGKQQWLRVPFCALPFGAIILFFQAGAHWRLFAVPTQVRLQLDDLAGLLAPAAMLGKSTALVGFYHVPLAGLLIGLSMLFAAKRYSVMAIFCIGAGLGFCGSVVGVSPVMWLTIPVLCLSVLIGEGTEGLIHAGFSDRRWVLASMVLMLALAVLSLLFGTEAAETFAGLGLKFTRLFADAARMYILGAVAAGLIFFMARGKTRVIWLRVAVLLAAIAIDIFLGATYIVDSIL